MPQSLSEYTITLLNHNNEHPERGNKRKSQLWAPLTWIAQQWKGWKKM